MINFSEYAPNEMRDELKQSSRSEVKCGACGETFEKHTMQSVTVNGELFCEDCFPEVQDQYDAHLEYLADQDEY